MKAVVAILGIVLTMAVIANLSACSKPEKPVVAPSQQAVIDQVKSNPAPVAFNGNSASFYSTPLQAKFNVKWSVFKNQHHPNGYVIIDSWTYDATVYRVKAASVPETYIQVINTGLAIAPMDRTVQEDYWLRCMFRTAEALVCASYLHDTSAPNEQAVWDAGQQMYGRISGVQAAAPLK